MPQKIYHVDAFTDQLFAGNPAAVCPLTEWLPDGVMQQAAMENNLAETAFYVPSGDQYEIRWFTPAVEVDLCGHATLATAYVLFHREGHEGDVIHFHSGRSGPLSVSREGDFLTLNFPADIAQQLAPDERMELLFGVRPVAVFKGKTDYMLVLENESQVRNAMPDLEQIARLQARGVIITAKGDDADFVSRFFAPQSGIAEDPVTGSAHTMLTPYWSRVLGKKELIARQLSARGGFLKCTDLGDRIAISGQARLYLAGEIFLPE